jgi:hypothetical protein
VSPRGWRLLQEDNSFRMSSDLVFLFSSEKENPERFFQGYFFHDADYVFGQTGFEDFRLARGLDRLAREDGCYVLAEKQLGGYRFSADYNGFKKLFYFWDNGFWVVSNSLRRISVQLRKHGYPVLPDVSQVAAMATEGTFYPSGRGSFFSQLATFDTIVRGVRLVPADCALCIGPSGVRLEKVICTPSDAPYRDQLGHFISTWIGRLRVLVNAPSVQISCDLTGGLDSRAVLALLLSAVHGSDLGIDDHLQIRSGGQGIRARKDRTVASKICRHFGLALNGEPAKSPKWLKGSTAYSLWKDLCLGVYHPIYFPNAAPSGDIIHFGGGGGENHRPFYSQFLGAPSAENFVAKRARNVVRRAARRGFEIALQQTIDRIMEGAPENLDALAGHYRHFRNRFHAGLFPQYTVTFQPLASKLLDSVTAAAGRSRFQHGQIHYDILHNSKPELLDIPFDSWRKRPSRVARQSFTAATAYPWPSGTCFIGDSRVPRKKPRAKKVRAIDQLHEEFTRAKNGCAVDLLGNAYVRRAERALQAAVRMGGFSGPIESKRVAIVIACAMFRC